MSITSNIKRITGLLLAICFCFSVVTLPALATEQPGVDSGFAEEIELLTALGILHYEVTPEMYSTAVTRAEMYGAVMGLLGDLTTIIRYSDYTFADAAEMPEADKIQLAVQLGFLETGWFFGPGDSANWQETVQLLVSVLGYREVAEDTAGDGAGYTIIANRIGLLQGGSAPEDGILTWGNFAALLCNAIDAEAVQIIGYQENGVKIGRTNGVTVLNIYFDIYKLEGVVRANEFTAMELGGNNAVEGSVRLENQLVKTGNTALEDMLGYDVRGYAQLKDNQYTALWFAPTNSNRVWRIAARNLNPASSQWSAFCITYHDENGRDRYLSLPSDISVIYNGKLLFDYTAEDLNIAMGEIVAVDSDGNGMPNVVLIDEYVNYIVDSMNTTEQILYAKNTNLTGEDNPLDLGNGKTVRLTGPDGENYALEDLTEYTILSLSVSKDKELIRGMVTKEKISGQIHTVQEKGGQIVVTTDMGSYSVNRAWDATQYDGKPEITAGGRYTMYLDKNGEVAAFMRRLSGSMYAFVVDGTTEGMFEPALKLKLFTENGSWEIAETRKKVTMNGTSVTSAALAKSNLLFQDGKIIQQMIKVIMDDEGKISKIYTPVGKDQAAGADEEALISYGAVSGPYKSSGSYMGLMQYGLAGMKIFVLPKVNGVYDEDAFEMRTVSGLVNDRSYTFQQTFDWSDTHVIKAAIMEGRISTLDLWNNGAVFVQAVEEHYDPETGTTYRVLSGMNKGKEIAYQAMDEKYLSGIQAGDILAVHLGQNGQIDVAPVKMYNVFDAFAAGNTTLSGTGSDAQYVYSGTVIAKDANALLVDDGTVNGRCVPLAAATQVTICNPSNSDTMFRSGTAAGVAKGAKVLLYIRSGILTDLIVLE